MSLAIPPALVSLGNARYANLNAEKNLGEAASAGVTLPAAASYAIISVAAQAVHISFDGTAATTDDLLLPVGTIFFLDNARTLLANIAMLEAAATASVYVAYFSGPQG